MHSADIILIWNSFLSTVGGTTTAWLHPKSITLHGLLASIWRGTEWHSVQPLSQTSNLKDNVVFLLWRTSLIMEWCSVLWMRRLFYQFKHPLIWKLVRRTDCHVIQLGTETTDECKMWLLKPQVAILAYWLHKRTAGWKKAVSFPHTPTPAVAWQASRISKSFLSAWG